MEFTLLLNELSSKLFQSEGYYSTLLNFFEHMKILIYDEDSNISKDDITVSLICKSIIDKTVKLQEENKQMKLSIRKLMNAFDNSFSNKVDTKDLSCSLPKDEPVSYYIDLIDKFINKLNSKKDDQNTFNISCIKNCDSNNAINSSTPKPGNNDQQKLEKMSKIIKDLKQKAEKIKTHKYISDAGIKRIERQLTNDSPELLIEDNDEKYDKIVNEIKKLQEKCKKFSNFCLILKSNLVENETDQTQIVKMFSDLKKEINNLLQSSDSATKVEI